MAYLFLLHLYYCSACCRLAKKHAETDVYLGCSTAVTVRGGLGGLGTVSTYRTAGVPPSLQAFIVESMIAHLQAPMNLADSLYPPVKNTTHDAWMSRAGIAAAGTRCLFAVGWLCYCIALLSAWKFCSGSQSHQGFCKLQLIAMQGQLDQS